MALKNLMLLSPPSSQPRALRRLSTFAPAAAAVACFLSASPFALADAYHSVEAGDTLSSVAARYKTRSEVLRAMNKLALSDSAALPSMLLRIPEGDANEAIAKNPFPALQAPNTAAAKAPVAAPAASPSGRGSISRSLRYMVQPGDSVESIALAHTQAGHAVSAQAIRDKNNIEDQPKAGSTLLIPVGGATYLANAQAKPGGAQSLGAVQVSEEIDWPVARVLEQSQPVYQAPNAKKSTTRRGPTVLGSRGYFPNPNIDGARVLQPNEEAPNAAPIKSPRSRVIKAPTAPVAAAAQKLARVAKVGISGARIRRLPDAQAVTLYSCPVSTELAVIKQSGPWSAILMSDRSTGWMPTRYLRFTSARVDISSIKLNEGFDDVRRVGRRGLALQGNWSSSHPVVATALSWLGTPYVYGGESRRGIDCSAMVQASFRDHGQRLPRTAAQQARVGRPVQPSELQTGDRLYFSASGSRVDHTGLYMGDGLFVHASGSGRSVIVSNLYDKRNWNIFVGARR
ncbi:MAG: hypothetical protein JWN98_735 [Abditibacteriota bacterium]|nr:hypothetical protein [Abditibacteriota bacterium]